MLGTLPNFQTASGDGLIGGYLPGKSVNHAADTMIYKAALTFSHRNLYLYNQQHRKGHKGCWIKGWLGLELLFLIISIFLFRAEPSLWGVAWGDQEHCASPTMNEIAYWLRVRREASGPVSHSLGPENSLSSLRPSLPVAMRG